MDNDYHPFHGTLNTQRSCLVAYVCLRWNAEWTDWGGPLSQAPCTLCYTEGEGSYGLFKSLSLSAFTTSCSLSKLWLDCLPIFTVRPIAQLWLAFLFLILLCVGLQLSSCLYYIIVLSQCLCYTFILRWTSLAFFTLHTKSTTCTLP